MNGANAVFPSRISFSGICIRLAVAAVAGALVAGAMLVAGWHEECRHLHNFGIVPKPSFGKFLIDFQRFHFASLNVAGLVFAIFLISSFKVHDKRSFLIAAVANIATLAFAFLTGSVILALCLPAVLDHH